jgi:acetate kinase
MKILVINCGSSSLKYQLIDMASQEVLASGLVERIGLADAQLIHKRAQEQFVLSQDSSHHLNRPITDHKSAIALVIQVLTAADMGVIDQVSAIDAVGHRVVHGGENYAHSVIIDEAVIAAIDTNCKLAPLHNPANLIGIKVCQELMPTTPMVAVFDTAFHQTMPAQAFLYSLPYAMYHEHKIRRYGFHGTSHQYVAEQAAHMLQRPLNELKLISCHLGNGASLCAIKNGQSIDTSMGFTPLAGLTMGTRCGDLDPSIIFYLAHELNLSVDEIDIMLNKHSGVLGISGVSSDFRDLDQAIAQGNQQAKLALEVFTYNVIKYIGAYVAAMNGIDAIIFTAGLGENAPAVRAQIIAGVAYLGVNIDAKRNAVRGVPAIISTAGSSVTALLIPTNEELMIARDTQALLVK